MFDATSVSGISRTVRRRRDRYLAGPFGDRPEAILGGSDVNPTSDGEDRFYAGLFLCYGLALLWCARDVQRKRVYVILLAAAFFVGGIGRLLALILVGAPHPFFIAMLVLELVVPPLMVLAANRVADPV